MTAIVVVVETHAQIQHFAQQVNVSLVVQQRHNVLLATMRGYVRIFKPTKIIVERVDLPAHMETHVLMVPVNIRLSRKYKSPTAPRN